MATLVEIGLSCAAVASVCFVAYRLFSPIWEALSTLNREVARVGSFNDTVFKRNVSSAAPVPLRRIIVFRFGLGEKFWKDVIEVSPEQYDVVRESVAFRPPLFKEQPETFFPSAIIELREWRSHREFTVSDGHPNFPEKHFAIYPFGSGIGIRGVILWERDLPRDERDGQLYPNLLGPRLQLMWGRSSFRLEGTGWRFEHAPRSGEGTRKERIFLDIPTHGDALDRFKRADEEVLCDGSRPYESGPWHTFYQNADQDKDVYWELEVLDLQRWFDEHP